MAGGNLGDLSFSLTLQSRIEQEAKYIVQALNKVDSTGQKAQNALNAVTAAVSRMGTDGAKAKETINSLKNEITALKDKAQNADISRNYQKAENAFTRILNLLEAINKENVKFSIEPTNKLEAGVQRVEEILQQRRHAREQEAKREAEIEDERQRKMQQSAQIAQETYSQEIKASREKAASFAADIRRQMEEEMRLRQLRITLPTDQLRSSFRKYYDIDTMSRPLTPTLNANGINDIQKVYGQAFDELQKKAEDLQRKLANYSGPETGWVTKTKAELADLERQMQSLITLSQKASAQLGNTYTPKIGISAQDEAATARRRDEIKKAFEQEAAAAKKAEEAERRYAEAIREANQVLRQSVALSRGNAESLVKDRIKDLEAQRRQLQELYGKGKGILDTAELAQVKNAFSQITQELNTLRSAAQNLGSYSIGSLFSMGRGTSNYAPMISEKREAIRLEEKHRQEIAETASKVRNELVSAFDQAKKSASGMNSTLQDLKSLFLQGGLVYGAKQFFDSIVQTGGEIVQQHIALRSIIGDIAKADELFEQTKQLALQSPFKFGELNRDVKQLAAFGVETNDLYDTTKRLADISSGLGVSFERLGLAYGQVKARSWLDGKELRQFAYAGLPLLKSIAELYNQTAKNGKTDYNEGDVKKMITNREVSFDDVKKVLWNMTDEGGKFYNMQFVLSDTLLGKWNKLIDAWDIMLGRFADGSNIIGAVFKVGIEGAVQLVQALDKLAPAVMTFAGLFAVKKGWGMLTSVTGIGSTLKQLQAAQMTQLRTYAVEQQSLMLEGKISAEKMKQNIIARQSLITSQATKAGVIQSLALQGKLSLLQMQRAAREKLISPELVKQMQLMGLISAKQSELILKTGLQSRAMLAVNQAWQKISGFFTWGNMAMLGIGAALAIWQKISAEQEEVKQRTKEIADSAREHAKSMADVLKENSGVDASDPQQLSQTNDALKGVLEQSGYYTDTIKEQVEQAGTLIEKYKILKKAVEDAKDSSNDEDKYSGLISSSISGTGSWLELNDKITDNANDVVNYYNAMSMAISSFDTATKERMESVANSILGPAKASESLEMKILDLQNAGDDTFDKFVSAVSQGDEDISDHLYNIRNRAQRANREFEEIAKDDIPKILLVIRSALGKNKADFNEWAKSNIRTVDAMFSKIISLCNINVPDIVNIIRQKLFSAVGLSDPQAPKQTNRPKRWVNPLGEGTVERKTFDKLLKAGKLNGGAGNFWQKEMANYIKTLNGGKSSGWNDFAEAVRKKYKTVRDENDSAKSAGQNQPYYRQQKMLEAIAAQNGISLDVGKNKATGNFGKSKNGRQEDKELDALKARISLYKTYYSELQNYRKTYGQDAESILKKSADFKPVFGYGLSDMSDYGKSIRELVDKLPQKTQDRRKFAEQAIGSIPQKERGLKEKNISSTNSELEKKLSLLSEEYAIYKELYELTGDREGSQRLAFGRKMQSTSILDSLEKQMEEALSFYNSRSGKNYTAKEVLGMKEGDFNNIFGENSEVLSVLYKQYRNETSKLNKETLTLMSNLIKDNSTIGQQLEDLDREHQRNVENIGRMNTTDEMRSRALEGENKTYGDKRSKLEFEKFKKDADWVTIFDDLDKVSTATIDGMIEKVDDFSRSTGLSVEVVKQLRDALDKLRKEQTERDPIGAMKNALSERGAILDFLKSATVGSDGKYYVSAEAGKRMGLKDGAYSKDELNSAAAGKYSGFADGLTSLTNKFKALESALSPVISLLSAYGKENTILGGILSGGSNALSAASGTMGAFETLGKTKGLGFLENAGPYAAAASAAVSIISSFAEAHDASLQREIEASKQRQKEMEDLTNNIETAIKNTLGGIYTYQMSADARKTMQKVQKNQGRYSSDTVSQTGKALQSGTAFDAEYASLMAQRDELQRQKDLESKKKKKDKTLINDLNQQIKEAEQKIDSFIDDFVKSIYDIDIKSWASELTDAIVEAWSKGEDAVDAYQDKVRELMQSLAKNIISQSIMESALKPVQEMIQKIMKEKGKLDATDIPKIGDMLMNTVDGTVDSIEGVMDYLKSKGWDLSENGSLSVSNSIKGVTEETADLLASYINAIRLDVSVNRASITQMLDYVKSLPNLTIIAQSQLTQLNQLVALATTRNEKLDMMYDWMRATTNGTKKVYVA